MDGKIQFIALALEGHISMTNLCSYFNISRKTGYKWLSRYHENGIDGLKDRSRAPKHIPHKTSAEATRFIVSCGKRHRSWGARKINQKADRIGLGIKLPSETTIHNILRRNGLVQKAHRVRKPAAPGPLPPAAERANQIWTTDYKGQFKTKDGRYCFPLTVMDEYSRYLIDCHGAHHISTGSAVKTFKRAFRKHGLPEAIKSDNGAPFATPAIARISKLSIWWIKLGINPVLIQPARPQQNGIHERMHRTLKNESTIPPEGNLKAQQKRFNIWRNEYNYQRPHDALNGLYPADLYKPSLTRYPKRVPEVEYPAHFELRRVGAGSQFNWRGTPVVASSVLIGETIGLEPVWDQLWAVYYFWKRLGFLDESKMKIIDDLGRLHRRKVLPMCL